MFRGILPNKTSKMILKVDSRKISFVFGAVPEGAFLHVIT